MSVQIVNDDSVLDRKEIERQFHNRQRLVLDDPHVADTRWSHTLEQTIRSNPLWANMKYYSVERKSRKDVLQWYERNTRNKVVLDYCCGNGEDGILIAKNWAREVIGVDISDVSVENATRHAERAGAGDRVTYLVRDAEQTGFEANRFDVITEYGSLHHLDLDTALSEMVRILKTPHLRTPWEVGHILRKSSMRVMHKYFRKVEVTHYHLVSLLAVPFRNTALFDPLLTALEAVDDLLLRIPVLRWQGWQMVIVLSEPNKHLVNASSGESS